MYPSLYVDFMMQFDISSVMQCGEYCVIMYFVGVAHVGCELTHRPMLVMKKSDLANFISIGSDFCLTQHFCVACLSLLDHQIINFCLNVLNNLKPPF